MKLKLSKHVLRISSILIAVVLWFYVLNSQEMTIVRSVKINYILPSGKAASTLLPSELSVKLAGPRSFLRSVLEKDIVIVDLAKGYKGIAKVHHKILPEHIPLSFGIKLVSYEPEFIDIELDRKIKKEVPVRSILEGELSSDYKIVNQGVEPSKVMIEGPYSIMKKTARIKVGPIELGLIKATGATKVTPVEVDPRIKIKYDGTFSYKYDVRAKNGNMKLTNVPIRFLSSNHRIKSKRKTVSVSVLVPEGVKPSDIKDKVQVIADIPERKRGWFRVKLKVKLPEGIYLLRVEPEKILVKK